MRRLSMALTLALAALVPTASCKKAGKTSEAAEKPAGDPLAAAGATVAAPAGPTKVIDAKTDEGTAFSVRLPSDVLDDDAPRFSLRRDCVPEVTYVLDRASSFPESADKLVELLGIEDLELVRKEVAGDVARVVARVKADDAPHAQVGVRVAVRRHQGKETAECVAEVDESVERVDWAKVEATALAACETVGLNAPQGAAPAGSAVVEATLTRFDVKYLLKAYLPAGADALKRNGPPSFAVRQTCSPRVGVEVSDAGSFPASVEEGERLAEQGQTVARKELGKDRFLLVATEEDKQVVRVVKRAGEKTLDCKVELEDGTATTDWKPLVAQAIDVCDSLSIK